MARSRGTRPPHPGRDSEYATVHDRTCSTRETLQSHRVESFSWSPPDCKSQRLQWDLMWLGRMKGQLEDQREGDRDGKGNHKIDAMRRPVASGVEAAMEWTLRTVLAD